MRPAADEVAAAPEPRNGKIVRAAVPMQRRSRFRPAGDEVAAAPAKPASSPRALQVASASSPAGAEPCRLRRSRPATLHAGPPGAGREPGRAARTCRRTRSSTIAAIGRDCPTPIRSMARPRSPARRAAAAGDIAERHRRTGDDRKRRALAGCPSATTAPPSAPLSPMRHSRHPGGARGAADAAGTRLAGDRRQPGHHHRRGQAQRRPLAAVASARRGRSRCRSATVSTIPGCAP